MNRFILIALLLFVGTANATWPKQDQDQDQAQEQAQAQDQAQDQQQHQTQTTTQDQANEQNISFSTPKQASSAIAPSVFGANPCYYGKSGAIGFDRVNLGGGKQLEDPNCAKLETARMLAALGERELGVEVVCATASAIEVLGDRCKATSGDQGLIEQIAFLKEQNTALLAERQYDQAECDAKVERCEERLKTDKEEPIL